MKVGDIVENFVLKDQFNNEFDLYKSLDSDVLLVFYPKDNSLVCTKQLKDYSANQSKLNEIGVKIIGINTNSSLSHYSFCTVNSIDIPILEDNDGKISKYFDAVNFLGINKRKLVLVGKDKRVKFIKSTLSVNYMDTDEIISELKT
jgi:thioredoxin-dependent peroxiredoxin